MQLYLQVLGKMTKFALRIVNNQKRKIRYGNEKNISTF